MSNMISYDQFHDGCFEGVWINEAKAHLFLSTPAKERFAAVATGVVRLKVEGLRQGNTILSVTGRGSDEIDLDDISELHELDGTNGELAQRLLAESRQRGLSILQIDASYGGTCLALVNSCEFLKRSEWARRYSGRLCD